MQHVFSHQNPYHAADWQQHQQQASHGTNHHQYSQSQVAAAAAGVAAAQQQHYNRGHQNGNGSTNSILAHGMSNGGGAGPGGRDIQDGSIIGPGDTISEDNRRVLEWIAQVLNASTRESALLELSKKREQVSELALILWHSFGMNAE